VALWNVASLCLYRGEVGQWGGMIDVDEDEDEDEDDEDDEREIGRGQGQGQRLAAGIRCSFGGLRKRGQERREPGYEVER